jgi:hypothetical protein
MLECDDEFTHECLAIRIARKLKAIDAIDVLSDLFIRPTMDPMPRPLNVPLAKAIRVVFGWRACRLISALRTVAKVRSEWNFTGKR